MRSSGKTSHNELREHIRDHYQAARKNPPNQLHHRDTVLVHPGGGFVFNMTVDKGGGMALMEEVTYWSSDAKKVGHFVFAEDIAEKNGLEFEQARALIESLVRSFYLRKGYQPITQKESVPTLSDVFLADRKDGFHLNLKWKGTQYSVALRAPVLSSERESCPSGKVTGLKAVPQGAVVAFEPPDTTLDAEAGPANVCTTNNGAALIDLRGEAPVVRYGKQVLTMKPQ